MSDRNPIRPLILPGALVLFLMAGTFALAAFGIDLIVDDLLAAVKCS